MPKKSKKLLVMKYDRTKLADLIVEKISSQKEQLQKQFLNSKNQKIRPFYPRWIEMMDLLFIFSSKL